MLHRLNQSFGSATYQTSDGNSIGNFGSLIVSRPASKGLTLRGIYIWGKSLDVYSTDGGLFANAAMANSNIIQAGNFAAQRGRSDFDIRQQFSLDGVWTVPNVWHSGWKKNVFGAWRLATVAQLETGSPFTVFTSSSLS